MFVSRKSNNISALIATSMARTSKLFNLALPSVFSQKRQPDDIIVGDDNTDPAVSAQVKDGVDDMCACSSTAASMAISAQSSS